jgi:putative tryptophan/tyrosine transport system substrate-binding protein
MMDRRTFIGAAAVFAAIASRGTGAQPRALRRIGYVGNGSPASGSTQLEALRTGLRELGWIEGQTFAIEHRFADGKPDRLPGLLEDLVAAKVDVIVVSGPLAIAAAQKATRTVPVVFVVLVDPVAMGFVRSLAQPGGNMTGLASQYEELITKQMQLLKEAVPGLSQVALLRHTTSSQAILTAAQGAAQSLGLVARTLQVTNAADFESAFRIARSERVGAVHVLPSPYIGAQRARVIELAARYRLPAFYELRVYVEDGGLMSYGPSTKDLYGRSASYVDRILKGASPGDLAVERPARFEFVINGKTAAALGLAIPQSLLQRADEVL